MVARIQARAYERQAGTLRADCTESTEIQRIQNDSEEIRKDPEGVGVDADLPPTLKSGISKNQDCSWLDRNLPLKEFVAQAAVESIDAASDSHTNGKWMSSTWKFVRLCRTHPKLMSLTAEEAFQKIPWIATGFEDEEQLQFIIEWDRVRCLPGVSPLQWAANMAQQRPLLSTRKHLNTFNRFIRWPAGSKF